MRSHTCLDASNVVFYAHVSLAGQEEEDEEEEEEGKGYTGCQTAHVQPWMQRAVCAIRLYKRPVTPYTAVYYQAFVLIERAICWVWQVHYKC